MTRSMPIVLICLLVSVLAPPAASPAAAESPAAGEVTLTASSPEVLGNSGDLTRAGHLTNVSGEELRRVEVRLWRDATPIRRPEALPGLTLTRSRTGQAMESASARAEIAGGEGFAPDQSAEFSVHASMAPDAAEQLWLSSPGAAYQVGVEVYGTTDSGGYQLLGRAAAVLGYPGSAAVPVSTVVLLAAHPTLLPLPANAQATEPVFADNSLASQLTGRLGALLTLAEQEQTTTVVDPALFDEVQALSRPHLVHQADGSLSEGSAAVQQLATQWLTRLLALTGTGRLAVGLYGSPDLLAAQAAGKPEVLAAARAALGDNHPLAELSTVVVPANGLLDEQTLAGLASVPNWLVLAANLPSTGLVYGSDGATVLAVQGPEVMAPGPGESPLQHRERLLATEILVANGGSVAVRLVTDVPGAELVGEQLAWRQPQRLDQAIGDRPTEPPVFEDPAGPPATADLVAATDRAIELFAGFDELTGEHDLTASSSAKALATAWSGTFNRDQSRQVAWLDKVTGPAAWLLSAEVIQLRISDWVTTSSADNLLPVTVNNNGGYPVKVRVAFESQNPLRISVADSDLFVVQPGESTTVRVSPRTEGNGKTGITAQVVSASGRTVGSPVDFVITGTSAGRVAWLIILASGAVLLVATGFRVRQVRRAVS